MLDHKKVGQKVVKISNTSYENEIRRADSPLNEDSKNIMFLAREALIVGEERSENLGKWPKTGKLIVMQIEVWSILTGNTGLCSLVSSSCITLVFQNIRSNYLLKTEEVSFQAKLRLKFAALPSLKFSNFDN